MQCNVCCENYTLSKRKPIECVYCNYIACTHCIKKYVLSCFQEPHCMSCKKEWNNEFMNMTFSRNFLTNVYREHRESLLLEREKAFLPETQNIIEINQNQQDILFTEITKYRDMRDKLSELIRLKSKQHRMLIENPALTLDDIPVEIESTRIRQYHRKCPETNCRGFINNRNLCGICKCKVCPVCLEKSHDENHQCDPDTVQTVQTLQKECKACPNCQIMIYKIDGCNQMWCTQCHTAFDWKTRQVIKHRIHNPHYFDYVQSSQVDALSTQSRNGGNDGTSCPGNLENGLPSIRQLTQFFHKSSPDAQIYSHLFFRILRSILHLSGVEIYRYPIYSEEELFRNNMILRIQYLKKELSVKMFKTILLRDEKQREKNKAMRLLYEMLINTFISIFQELFSYSLATDIENSILVQIETLRSYVNKQLSIISHNFKCRKIMFDAHFEIQRV